MKEWQEKKLVINNLEINVRYSKNTINELFTPLLEKWTKIYKENKKRIIVFLAAPPGIGKTTISQFLEELSRENDGIEEIQGIGMDGFHFPNTYLDSNYIEKDGEKIKLRSIKGAPETFDYEKLRGKLEELKTGDTKWPVYSRKLHDPEEDKILVDKNIIVLEGNWLLLDEERWRELVDYSDYSILIKADEQNLRDRLIERKIMGGLTREEATKFYEASDKKNITRVLNKVVDHKLTLQLEEDEDYKKVGGEI